MAQVGRPRNDAIDAALVRAVAELIAERGFARVTIEDVVARAGTSKPAFYRRFKDLADMVPTVLGARHGLDADIDTGGLVTDLLEVQRRQTGLFSDPVTVRGLGGWLAAVDADPERGTPFVEHYLAPRRAYTHVIIARAAERGEIATDATHNPAWVADLLTGPLIMYAMLPGLPPVDLALGIRAAHAALTELGFAGDRSALDAALAAASQHDRVGPEGLEPPTSSV